MNMRTGVGIVATGVWAFLGMMAGLPAAEPAEAGAQNTTRGGVAMVLVPAGEFEMGQAAGGADDEKPVHKVKLGAFLMDRTEVTQKEYERLMGENPSKWKGQPDNPVEQVRWTDAVRYCNARSEEEGLEPCYNLDTWRCDFSKNGYRLPTEAEWEYACRAGSKTAYCCGDDPKMLQIYAWHKKNSGQRPRPVGKKRPNAWGLCDLHGNVWEYCHDFYQVDYYKQSPAEDPTGPEKTERKVMRGGAFSAEPEQCRSACRFNETPGFADICFPFDSYGFRCVRKAGP